MTASHNRAVRAVAGQFWINGMVYASLVPRFPEIRERLEISNTNLGVILALAGVGGFCGSAASSSIIERFGSRETIVVATFAALAILPLVGLAPSSALLIVLMAALASLDVLVDIAMNLQGSWLSARRAKPIMNRLHGLWSVGSVIGGLAAVRATAAGLSLFTHLAVVAVVLAAAEVLLIRHLLGSEELETASAVKPLGSQDLVDSDLVKKPPLRPRLAFVLAFLGAAAIAMEMTTTDWAAFRLADDLGVDGGRVGLGFVPFTSGMVTGRFLGDNIEVRLGEARMVRIAAGLAGVGLALATLVPLTLADGAVGFVGRVPSLSISSSVGLWISTAGFFVAALGVSVIFPQLYDAAAKAPGRPGQALGAMTAGSRLATLATPLMVGLFADQLGVVGLAVAVVTIPSCVFVAMVRMESSDDNGDDHDHRPHA